MKHFTALMMSFIITISLNSETIVKIYPKDEKQSTGVYVRKGEKLKFRVNGKWSLWDKYKQVGPEGHQFTAGEYGNWGTLLGKVGSGTVFMVGNESEIPIDQEGVLYLFPNKGKYKINNPSGFLEVSIDGGISVDDFIASISEKSVKISVDPKKGFISTGIFVDKGETVIIYAFGTWTMWNGTYPMVSAEGHEFIANGVSWGKLFGGIGSTNGQYLDYFPVGERTVYTAGNPGILSLYPYTGNYVSSENGELNVYIVGGKKAADKDAESADENVRKIIEQGVVSKINTIRAALKLPKIEINPKLSRTAADHSRYMIVNDTFSRDENETDKFFTAKTFEERIKKAGFEGKAAEMFAQTDSALDAVDLLVNSVYHRLRILNPAVKYIGYGSFRSPAKTIHVIDLGYEQEDNVSEWETVAYPPNNITEVKVQWSGIENPDPFPVGTIKPLGMPVTLMLGKKINKVLRSDLVDESGKQINCFIITPETDLNNKMFNAVILVPKMPLAQNTRYSATMKINVGKNKEDKDYTWSFVTESNK